MEVFGNSQLCFSEVLNGLTGQNIEKRTHDVLRKRKSSGKRRDFGLGGPSAEIPTPEKPPNELPGCKPVLKKRTKRREISRPDLGKRPKPGLDVPGIARLCEF